MILLAALLALPNPIGPHPATVVPDQHFGRWTLSEVQDAYPPKSMPFGPWALGRQTLSMASLDGRIGWTIEANNLGFGTRLQLPATGKMKFGVSAGPDDFPGAGEEDQFFDQFASNLALLDKRDLTPLERLRYRKEFQSSRSDFIVALKVMKADAQALYGGVHRVPPCNPPSCIY